MEHRFPAIRQAQCERGLDYLAFLTCWPSTLKPWNDECRSHVPAFPPNRNEFTQLSLFSEMPDAFPVDNLEEESTNASRRTT